VASLGHPSTQSPASVISAADLRGAIHGRFQPLWPEELPRARRGHRFRVREPQQAHAGRNSGLDRPGARQSAVGRAARLGKEAAPVTPAVPVKKSITDDYLISLEDGKRYKSLKRHLNRLGLTPQSYRQKYGLPGDYPMVAPSYARARSEMARSIGLGRKRTQTSEPPASKRSTKKAKAAEPTA
jgi:predicted transcriptional regulator